MSSAIALLAQGPPPDFSELFESLARIAFFLFLFVFPLIGGLLRKLREKARQGQARQERRAASSPEGGRSAAEVEGRDLWRELLEGAPRERTGSGSVLAELEAADAAERAEQAEAARDAAREAADAAEQRRIEIARGDDVDEGRREREAALAARRAQLAREAQRVRELEEARRRAAERPAADGWRQDAAPELAGELAGEWKPPEPALGTPLDVARGTLAAGEIGAAADALAPIDEDRLEAGWRPPARGLVELGGLHAARAAAPGSATATPRVTRAIARRGRSEWRRAVLYAEVLGPPLALRPPEDPLGSPGLRPF